MSGDASAAWADFERRFEEKHGYSPMTLLKGATLSYAEALAMSCTRCGGDGKIRCEDPECFVCAMDGHCDSATVCTHGALPYGVP